jgi:hypothetical protein
MPFKDKEKAKEYSKRYYFENILKIKEHNQKDEVKKRNSLQQHNRQQSLRGKYKEYKFSSKKRNIEFNLTLEQFETFLNKPCEYCGDIMDKIGIDRVDNTKGYTMENCVPCHEKCNKIKNKHDKKFFILKCIKISNRFK